MAFSQMDSSPPADPAESGSSFLQILFKPLMHFLIIALQEDGNPGLVVWGFGEDDQTDREVRMDASDRSTSLETDLTELMKTGEKLTIRVSASVFDRCVLLDTMEMDVE